jgi:hypothetical protein
LARACSSFNAISCRGIPLEARSLTISLSLFFGPRQRNSWCEQPLPSSNKPRVLGTVLCGKIPPGRQVFGNGWTDVLAGSLLHLKAKGFYQVLIH